jgi:hypothetical protein
VVIGSKKISHTYIKKEKEMLVKCGDYRELIKAKL